MQYRVEFGPTGSDGHGVLEIGPGTRVCLTLDARPPNAAHLHLSSPEGPSDSVLVTLFEPPTEPEPRTCVDDADARAAGLIEADPARVYVDLHYNPRDNGVVGRLGPDD